MFSGVAEEDIAVFERAIAGKSASRKELVRLLNYNEKSLTAGLMRAVSDRIIRDKSNNRVMLLGQIGVETYPCPANCKFCAFAQKYTAMPQVKLSREKVLELSRALVGSGDLYALFLMFMHEYDFNELLEIISAVRGEIGDEIELVVNIGDFDKVQAAELRSAGVGGAYHVLRLRESIDTDLAVQGRINTIEAIHSEGLHWYNCCEPVGPEHNVEEIVDQLLFGREFEPFQHAAMRRVALSGSPLAKYGQISELRLGQIVSGVTLAMAGNKNCSSVAVHEPNMIGLVSGANSIYAESGANPRDLELETSSSRGFDIECCQRFAVEAGFEGFF